MKRIDCAELNVKHVPSRMALQRGSVKDEQIYRISRQKGSLLYIHICSIHIFDQLHKGWILTKCYEFGNLSQHLGKYDVISSSLDLLYTWCQHLTLQSMGRAWWVEKSMNTPFCMETNWLQIHYGGNHSDPRYLIDQIPRTFPWDPISLMKVK